VKIALVQLGCPKNLVDGEWVIGQLVGSGHSLVSYEDAEAVLVNTCGFIDAAKEESLEKIIEAVELKKQGKFKKVIVFGCLSERYRESLKEELPEVDGFFPLSAISEAVSMLEGGGEKFPPGKVPLPEIYTSRLRLTPFYTTYVKIAEGCNHLCSFCAIPKIRGRFRSRSLKAIVNELRAASEDGVKEALLVAQDSTSWGTGLKNKTLVDLIRGIDESQLPLWVRILYLYPSKVTKNLLEVWANSEMVLPYFDIPFQHSSKRVLESMRRAGSYKSHIQLIERIRKTVKGSSIRSSFIVGYPTEQKADYDEMIRFLKEAELDNVGFFGYSREEGTPAFKLKGGAARKVQEERLNEIVEVQKEISYKKNKERVGGKFKVLVEGVSQESDLLLEGRAYFQAPEVDGKIYITKGNAVKGEFSEVRITNAHHYDLAGEITGGRKKKNAGG
jgi:ribosomal protein S12 methylthiotransferase